MRLQPGQGSASGTTVRLRRNLYGLKQSPLQWNSLLVSTLQQYVLSSTWLTIACSATHERN